MIDAMESTFKWGMVGMVVVGACGGCGVGGALMAIAMWMGWL